MVAALASCSMLALQWVEDNLTMESGILPAIAWLEGCVPSIGGQPGSRGLPVEVGDSGKGGRRRRERTRGAREEWPGMPVWVVQQGHPGAGLS